LSMSTSIDVDGVEIDAAFGRLSEADQEILRLIHWDALTRTEAAEVLRLTPNATNVRYHRALQRLRDQMPPQHRRIRTEDTYPTLNSTPVKGALP
jgi:DNA-directed RNA polymerase specialized sigma24 family protein